MQVRLSISSHRLDSKQRFRPELYREGSVHWVPFSDQGCPGVIRTVHFVSVSLEGVLHSVPNLLTYVN